MLPPSTAPTDTEVPARRRSACRGDETNGAMTWELPCPLVTGAVAASAPITAIERVPRVLRGRTPPAFLSNTADCSAAVRAKDACWGVSTGVPGTPTD